MRNIYYCAALIVLVASAQALKCYTGSGPARVEFTCFSTQNQCSKYVIANTVPVYTCSSSCSPGKNIAGGETTCCNTDLCNSASNVQMSFVGIAFAVVAALLKL